MKKKLMLLERTRKIARLLLVFVGVASAIGGYYVCASDPFGGLVMGFGGMILIVWAISSH